MVYRPPTHGILTPLPMVYRPPYPWYIEPPTHGILTPLPMEYRPPYLWYIKPSLMVLWIPLGRNEGGFNFPWGGSKYNDKKLTPGSKYHKENWTQGQNIIGKLTPGSIYHGVQNTIWHRFKGDFPNPGPGLQRAQWWQSRHHCFKFSVIPGQ